RKQSSRQQLAAWYAEHQAVDSPGTNDFWKHAVQGTRLPQKETSADLNLQFRDPNLCYKWHLATHDSLDNAQGVVISFLKLCKMQPQCSRRELLERILDPHFLQYPRDKRFFQNAVRFQNGGHTVESRFWNESIIDRHSKSVTNRMLSWCMRLNTAQTGLEVAMATDVLWVVLGQALFTGEWQSAGGKQSAVVHNRNIANAAEVLTFLFMHTSLPMAYIPVNSGAVVLSEPSHALANHNAAVSIPYVRALHVDYEHAGGSFLSRSRHAPSAYSVVHTREGMPIAVLQPVVTRNAFNHTKVHVFQLSPYPPECTAHMLPYLQQLQDADEAFRAKTPMHPHADCTWPLSTRLLGRSITPENSMHLPVCLPQQCMHEEIPCFTYRDGFTFVLKFIDDVFHVIPVDVLSAAPDYYGDVSFTALPVAPAATATFAPSALAYTIRQGLQMRADRVFVHPPPTGDAEALAGDCRALPFVMSPVVRYEALVLLNRRSCSGGAFESFGQHQAAAREQLAIGVLRKHATGTYLERGHYCMHSFDAEQNVPMQENIDFTFVHRCMLMDGHVVYWSMTQADYADLVGGLYAANKNDHIRERAFTLDHDRSADLLFVQCFYTVAHHAPAELQDAKIQVMFIIKDKNAFTDNDATAFYDVSLFDANCDLKVHIMPPEDASLVVTHFIFE
ncbi:MAG: hypothetical protein WCP68_05895, partial [Enhydrobacter sp.]